MFNLKQESDVCNQVQFSMNYFIFRIDSHVFVGFKSYICIFQTFNTILIIANLQVLLFSPSGDFWHLLMTFANSLDPDQGRQILDPKLFQ